jgi:ankyrin repeat protein
MISTYSHPAVVIKQSVLWLVCAVFLLLFNPHALQAQAVIDAVKQGDANRVKQLITANARRAVADTDGVGNTALQWAAELGRTEIARLLLQGGAEINSRGDGGATSILHAARNGHLDIIELFVKSGADVDAADSTGITPLHEAAFHNQVGSITYLVMFGATIDARNHDGNTPLAVAAFNGHANACKLLIGLGADLRVKNSSGNSPIDEAQRGGKLEIADLMSTYDAELQLRADGEERRLDEASSVRTSFANWADSKAVSKPVYTQNFGTDAVGPEWSTTRLPGLGQAPLRVSTTPNGKRRFFGNFGSQAVHLSLPNLPPHHEVAVKFDLFIIDTWDGNDFRYGPDIWRLSVEHGPVLLNTTFANTHEARRAVYSQDEVKNIRIQSYPDAYPGGHNPIYSGADEVNTLGYKAVLSGQSIPMDAVYTMRFTFRHSLNNLRLDFAAHGLEALDNESWGIANLQVCVDSPAPVTLATKTGIVAPHATTSTSKPNQTANHSAATRKPAASKRRLTASKRKPTGSKSTSAKTSTTLHDKKKPLTP